MERSSAWMSLPGRTSAEKLLSLGVEKRRTLDVRTLDEIARHYGVWIFLFFEEGLARDRTLESVQEEFSGVPEYERPFIRVEQFLRFTRENDPSFEQTLREFPLMIEIVGIGDADFMRDGKSLPYVTGMMPFLDELDVDGPPPS
ncbi:MAG TPA: hypothetical protein VEI81_04075 [Methanoregula sp.]|nr:hypothetical protein [Methanoregula sp.]